MVIEGVLIAESLRTEARLEDVALTVRAIARADDGDTDAGQPLTWTFIEFEAPLEEAERLAAALSRSVASIPTVLDCHQIAEESTAPAASRQTSSTASPSESIVTTTCAPRTASCGESATVAPATRGWTTATWRRSGSCSCSS